MSDFVRLSFAGIQYELVLSSKITVIRGFSGTGKSELAMAVESNNRKNIGMLLKNREISEVANVISSKTCITLTNREMNWKGIIESVSDCIIFVDETFDLIGTAEFADAVIKSNNKFVLITREELGCLSYGYYDIYEFICESGVNKLKQVYDIKPKNINIDTIITEDSGSGCQFIKRFGSRYGINVITCNGNANIRKCIIEYKNTDKNVLIIADGAGLGSYIKGIAKEISECNNISLWLPESFEWLLLHSLVFNNEYDEMLNNVRDISGDKYINAERLCLEIIKSASKNTPYEYSKSSCRKCYTSSCMKCKGYDKCKYKTPHTTSAKLLSVMCMYKYIDEIVKKR